MSAGKTPCEVSAALTSLCDLHPLGVKLFTNPTGVLSQVRKRGSRPAQVQEEKEDDRVDSGVARQSARSQIRPE